MSGAKSGACLESGAPSTADDLEATIQALGRDAIRLFGGPTPDLSVTARLSRPFSEIAKVRVGARDGPTSVFVKVARTGPGRPDRSELRRRVVRDFELNQSLHAFMKVCKGLSVVRPVACYPDHLAIVTEEAPGETLLVHLERRARWWPGLSTRSRLIQDFERIGAWLRSFQSAIPVDRVEDLLETRQYIDVRLKRLVDSPRAGFSEGDRLAVLRAVDLCAGAVTQQDRRSVAAHADFALGNILIDASCVTVLDFAMGANGLRLHDLAHLYMQLDLLTMKPSFRRQTVSALQRALLAGYQEPDVSASPLFRMLLVQHRACHYLGLVERPGAGLEALYNARIARAHLAQLRLFAASPTAPEGAA